MEMKFVKRFSLADRRLHWLVGLGVLILLVTGIIIYFIGAYSGSPQKVSHFLGGMLFFFTPVIYLLKVKEKRKAWLFIFKWDSSDVKWFKGLFSKNNLPQGKYNPLQKLSFLLVVVVGIVASITGTILVFASTSEITRFIHNISTIIIGSFLILHGTIYLVKPYRRALRSMIKGIMDVKYAEEYHKLWFEKVKTTAFTPQGQLKPAKQVQNVSK